MGSDFSRRCAEPAVEMVGVGKAYGPNALFRGVNLAVRRGGCAALIGRNGVGKTTLLRIAAGLTAPTEGTVRRALNLSIGYVPENLPRLPMTARQFLRHMAAIEGLGEEDEAEGRRLITDFSLDDLMDLPMTRLSKGTLQKVAVMQAFLRRRDLLILDEPLSGQDEKSREVFIDRCFFHPRVVEDRKLAALLTLLLSVLGLIKQGPFRPVAAAFGARMALIAAFGRCDQVFAQGPFAPGDVTISAGGLFLVGCALGLVRHAILERRKY